MPETIIYEGPVKVYTAKPDGTPLTYTPQKGPNAGKVQPFAKLSFPYNGQTIYLADFTNGVANILTDTPCKVAFEQEFLPPADAFTPAQPKMYNNQPQYMLKGIQPLGGTQAQATAQAQPQAQAQGNAYNPEKGLYQTAVNASATINAALIGLGVLADPLDFDTIGKVLTDADRIHKYLLTGKTDELDQALATAKASLGDEDIPFGDGPPPEDY